MAIPSAGLFTADCMRGKRLERLDYTDAYQFMSFLNLHCH